MDKEILGASLALAALLLPVAAALLSCRVSALKRWLLGVIIPASCFVLVAVAAAVTPSESHYTLSFPRELPPVGLSVTADRPGLYFGMIVSAVWALVSIYCAWYLENDPHSGRFYTASLLSFSGTLGVALAGDMFTLFLFFELMSLAAYVLIIHERTPESFSAGFKYLLMTIGGSLGLFFGLILTYHTAGSLSFARGPFGASAGGFLAFMGYFLGFGIKAGVFPLHVWLPDAHPVAPSPASALLSGLMIKTGAFGLVRVIYQIFGVEYLGHTGWNMIPVYLGVVTIFIGSAVAILQDDLKRRLAYSSVAQIGYIVTGLSLLNHRALQGALFHVFGHALMKASLFMAAGVIIRLTGRRKVEDLAGLGQHLPFTFFGFSIAALSMVGIPPLVGFTSKWHIAWGALDAGMPWIVAVLLISSFMNGIYYLPIVISAFFKEKKPDIQLEGKEAPRVWVPITVLAAGIFLVGLVFGNIPLTLADQAAGSVLNP
ncbi:MAG: monovalent cation/H+ antiporter subunit D family protein [Candidatus Fermentithermobacillus carboniphilus]|uniref:Monovalent cation/H+ antiporter subunit D family protein n=1 Tax=Candidatus Fermentithermobacillus carboniphilus TaxID=3085328 RepID=A0AAT9LCC2_9FIRM|nr:MAG: monovalent cation/H+ antiporter subunit D family protein [Candidatus Fermentithermobacillus carboniphilus]